MVNTQTEPREPPIGAPATMIKANAIMRGANINREFQQVIAAEPGWRRVVATAASLAIPVPAISESLAYFDTYTSANLPQNLTQAQRDYFGAHTWHRADDPWGAFVHADWKALIGKDPEENNERHHRGRPARSSNRNSTAQRRFLRPGYLWRIG